MPDFRWQMELLRQVYGNFRALQGTAAISLDNGKLPERPNGGREHHFSRQKRIDKWHNLIMDEADKRSITVAKIKTYEIFPDFIIEHLRGAPFLRALRTPKTFYWFFVAVPIGKWKSWCWCVPWKIMHALEGCAVLGIVKASTCNMPINNLLRRENARYERHGAQKTS